MCVHASSSTGREVTCAMVEQVCSLAVDKDGTMFVGTESAFYSMSPAGRLALIAGSEHEKGYRDGQGSEARFNIPRDLAVDRDGSLLVADTYNNRLRRVSAMGTVSTIAGSGEAGRFDGIGPAARFNRPRGISLDVHGTIYISDHLNHCIRKVTPANGMVSTLCGSLQSEEGFVDAVGADARFHFPTGISLDTDANLIVADYGNHCIRKVSTCNGRVITVAGSRAGQTSSLRSHRLVVEGLVMRTAGSRVARTSSLRPCRLAA